MNRRGLTILLAALAVFLMAQARPSVSDLQASVSSLQSQVDAGIDLTMVQLVLSTDDGQGGTLSQVSGIAECPEGNEPTGGGWFVNPPPSGPFGNVDIGNSLPYRDAVKRGWTVTFRIDTVTGPTNLPVNAFTVGIYALCTPASSFTFIDQPSP